MNKCLYIVLITVFFAGCFPSGRVKRSSPAPEIVCTDLNTFCDSVFVYETLFIQRVKAKFQMEGEFYDATLSLFYIPDSVLFLTASNTGFEIIRVAVFSDSAVFINRIDKLVIIYKESEIGYSGPVSFSDLEYLMNSFKVCIQKENLSNHEGMVLLDRSEIDIQKIINFESNTLKLQKFEFFHRKTGEYIVGEWSVDKLLKIYSNFIFDDVEVSCYGGDVSYNKSVFVDIGVNRNKYSTIYYR